MYVTAKGVELRLSARPLNWVAAVGTNVIRAGTAMADAFQGMTGDTLVGGLGDDTYHLWTNSAAALEAAAQGIDTVYAYYWGSASLAANVENLILSGKGLTAATGNALDNIIVAGSTAATLNGLGGDDVLVGGTGADIFVIAAGNGSDAIYGFTPGYDIVRLSGYGMNDFGQIVSRSEQVGADLAITLSNGERLVLRDVDLGDLDPTDFGLALPKASVPAGYAQMYGASRGYNAHGWYVMTNAWNPGTLKYGTDFSIDAIYNKNDMTGGTTFNWSFPYVTEVAAPIRAYPNIMFGIGPHGEQVNPTDTSHLFPVKVGSLASLTATLDVSLKGNVGGYNVSYDIWFTTEPDGSEPTITNEVMIWVHQGDVKPFGTAVGTYQDGAFTATIYRDGHYTALVADQDMLSGTIDITKVIAYLQTLGILSAEEYLACINLGAEVISGNGSLTINDFELDAITWTSEGAVSTHVTGSGSQVTDVVDPAPEIPLGWGDNILDGTGNAVADTLQAGPGNDIYHVDAEDFVVEATGEGVDEVRTAAGAYQLSAHVEILTGLSATGQQLTGNDGDNLITGGAGNDVLDGAGGVDTLRGGLGNDLYLHRDGATLEEAANAGVDEVRTASAAYTLPAEFEILTGSGDVAQTLTGNDAGNVIDGGAGADRMIGLGGNDIYLVDVMGDVVVEAAGGGIDEVRTALGNRAASNLLYVLPANVENLVGTSSAAQGVRLNALDNIAVLGGGGDLVNAHDGGNDRIVAGGGNDTVYFGGALTNGDSVDGGAGTDTVSLVGVYTIAFDADDLVSIENLTLYGFGTPTAPVTYDLTMNDVSVSAGQQMLVLGDSLLANDVLKFNGAAEAEGGFNVRSGRGADTLRGGAGADRLWGNEGADTLTGGAGKDVFEYASAAESTNAQRDLIRDFERGDMLSFGAIDADGTGVAGNGSFLFVGAAAFSGRAGELRLLQDGTNTWLVEGDTNGDRIADLSIAVLTPGGYQMSAVDFQF
ncbi:M10 family metallopeptidase C-terminal domain-containing protein [Sphingosinicella sp. BN140058]|uniref:GH12 family glycosyl hydrolase domain-containing protein n=1 Tax=Sphingosinicella sp. BN140058 TaxID=1892855 RepID=UPI00101127D4|nr:hypothetical protein [Sphingosinicella sp. BN140058]QAY78894.1 hypothetical protein ETR14_21895 [Sphingosinicella sp. BN140058]